MKTYEQLIKEAQGFQGPFKPDADTKRQAIELGKKVNPGRLVKKGKPLATNPSDKGSAIVKSPGGERVKKEPVGYPKVSGPGTRPNAGKLAKSPGGSLVRQRHSGAADEKQAGTRPGTTRGQKVKKPLGSRIPRTMKDFYKGAKQQGLKNIGKKPSESKSQYLGRQAANKTGDALKAVGNVAKTGLKRALTPKDVKSSSGSSLAGQGSSVVSKYSK